MDYEFRILLAEKELAHLREMHGLMRTHIDVHDTGFKAAEERFERIEGNLERTNTTLAETALLQKVTEQKLQSLIDLLVREHSNGHPK